MRTLVQPPPSTHCDLCGGELRLKQVEPANRTMDLDNEILVCVNCGRELLCVVDHDRYAAHYCESRKSRLIEGWPMHKFKLRQTVFLQPTIFNRDAPRGAFEVTKQLPERDGQFEYRIKSSREPHERVVRESELSLE